MQPQNQLILKVSGRQVSFICVNEDAIFEFKIKEGTIAKKIFPLTKQLYLQVSKIEFQTCNGPKFIVKLTEDTRSLEILLQNKQDLEKLFLLTGKYSSIKGLHDLCTSFQLIGQGSFAQVYLATTKYQTTFALKSFDKKAMRSNQKTKKAFSNEISLLKALHSPYIVSYDYLFQTDTTYYLKMQQFPLSLKQKLAQKVVIKQQKLIMRQLLCALLEMNNKNIIHRDLKPDNIMIRNNPHSDFHCVLIDFGLGTLAHAPSYLFSRCGTPGFLSPEIANLNDKKTKQNCRSDMFSLGCIFYKILTGHYLFTGKTAKQVLQKNRRCEYSFCHLQALTLKQKDLLVSMIEPDPQVRITPQKALHHPYFQEQIDDADEIPEEAHFVDRNIKKLCNISALKNMESIRSSLLGTYSSQKLRPNYDPKKQLKDSCLTFEIDYGSVQVSRQMQVRTSHSPVSRSCCKKPSKFRLSHA